MTCFPAPAICVRNSAKAISLRCRIRPSGLHVSTACIDEGGKIAHLCADDVPFGTFPILVRFSQSLDIGIFPDSVLVTEALVAHLKRSNGVALVGLCFEANDHFFPWEVLLFLELEEKLILFVQGCRRSRRSAPAAFRGGNIAGNSLVIVITFAFLQHRARIRSNAGVRSPRLSSSQLWT